MPPILLIAVTYLADQFEQYFKSIEKVGLGKGFEQKLPLRLRTVSLVSPPQTPADSAKPVFDDDHLVELTPDSMSSRIQTWPVI